MTSFLSSFLPSPFGNHQKAITEGGVREERKKGRKYIIYIIYLYISKTYASELSSQLSSRRGFLPWGHSA